MEELLFALGPEGREKRAASSKQSYSWIYVAIAIGRMANYRAGCVMPAQSSIILITKFQHKLSSDSFLRNLIPNYAFVPGGYQMGLHFTLLVGLNRKRVNLVALDIIFVLFKVFPTDSFYTCRGRKFRFYVQNHSIQCFYTLGIS